MTKPDEAEENWGVRLLNSDDLAPDLIQEWVRGEPTSRQALAFLMEQMACSYLSDFLTGCAFLSPSTTGFVGVWIQKRKSWVL